MSIALTFTDKKLVDTALVTLDGALHYTTSTTEGRTRRKTTTISAASGLVGFINWREKVFSINGVRQKWEDLKERSNGIFSSEWEWHWGSRSYKLKFHKSHKELLDEIERKFLLMAILQMEMHRQDQLERANTANAIVRATTS
ncbi:hypothetical protein C8F04DRAFT_1258472 [Mycena alexandri]|uniref:Uncharacterized protein n=1 Tax=Mycena alexandri TaxID=1745969 RepID=A0AAD6SXV1_9AGAR|nr:hypothetical protein C8F04DRAFT_1258472 [Mycena alexandri]